MFIYITVRTYSNIVIKFARTTYTTKEIYTLDFSKFESVVKASLIKNFFYFFENFFTLMTTVFFFFCIKYDLPIAAHTLLRCFLGNIHLSQMRVGSDGYLYLCI